MKSWLAPSGTPAAVYHPDKSRKDLNSQACHWVRYCEGSRTWVGQEVKEWKSKGLVFSLKTETLPMTGPSVYCKNVPPLGTLLLVLATQSSSFLLSRMNSKGKPALDPMAGWDKWFRVPKRKTFQKKPSLYSQQDSTFSDLELWGWNLGREAVNFLSEGFLLQVCEKQSLDPIQDLFSIYLFPRPGICGTFHWQKAQRGSTRQR